MAYIDAVDEFIASRAGEEQWIWDMLLNPKDAAGVEIGADWNLMAFLLSDPDQLNIAKLTDDFDEAIDRGMKAYVSYLSGTPEGQQYIMSSHRGSAGAKAKRKMTTFINEANKSKIESVVEANMALESVTNQA